MLIDFATREDIQNLQDSIDALTVLVQKMAKDKVFSKTISIKDICSMKGISRTQLVEREPYLMPNNGQSDYAGKKRWDLETYQAWDARPVAERKKAWEVAQRRK